MTKENKYRISQLICNYLCGNLTEKENQELNTWLKENESNKQLFDQIISGKTFDSKYDIYNKNNWKDSFRKFEKSTNQSYFLHKRLLRYTAILLLPLAIVIYYLFSLTPDSIQFSTKTFSPGHPKAILILSDGQKVELDSTSNAKISLPVNIQMDKQKKLLTYVQKNSRISGNNILKTPKGGEYQLILSDGTLVHLNAASQLTYPETFPTDKREVCISGEAWFEVARDSIRPFYVNTEDLEIRVIGTKFNINTYIPNQVQTALAEGCIQITTGNKDKAILHPNQLAEYDRTQDILKVKETDLLPYISWKDGLFVFSGEKLEDIMKKLSLWYNFQTFYTQENLKTIRFTGYLKRYEDISVILKAIEQTVSVKFEIKGQTIIVSQ